MCGWISEWTRRCLLRKIFLAVAAAGLCAVSASCDRNASFEIPPVWGLGENVPIIRVGIVTDTTLARIEIRMPYEVQDIASGRVIAEGASMRESEVTREKGGFNLGRLFVPAERIQVVPQIDGTIVVKMGEVRRSYRGKMAFVPTGEKTFAIVNYVNLEHYVASVVSGEMYSDWPEAALRAQAVAARTYALWRMNQKGKKEEWDLTAGQESQMYPGLSGEIAVTRKAAQDTFGVVLTYEGKIFAAYYHSTCGDSTASVQDVFGEEEIPPLSSVTCRNCRESPFYRWTVNVSQEEMVERLKSAGFAVEQISDVKVVELDQSGRAKSVEIDTGKKKFYVKPGELRKVFGASRIRSTAFSIALERGVFVIRGAGWGHGVGMCQWGAYGMAKWGFDAEGILRHFYQESEIVRLY
jgi:stage II sporulation protein D